MDLPSSPFTREGKAESAAGVRGAPAVYRGGFFDYTIVTTPRTGGAESDGHLSKLPRRACGAVE